MLVSAVLPSTERTVYPVNPSFRISEVTASSDFEVRGGNGATKLQWRNRARERPINRSAENDKIECESCVRAPPEFCVGMAALVERRCESNLDKYYLSY